MQILNLLLLAPSTCSHYYDFAWNIDISAKTLQERIFVHARRKLEKPMEAKHAVKRVHLASIYISYKLPQ